MPTYLFTAKNKEGESQAGHLEAINQHELAALLRQQGLTLISAEVVGPEKRIDYLNIKGLVERFGLISLVEKMMFTQHLGVMIGAGLPLSQALQILAEQAKNHKFKRVISQIEQNIRQGEPFSNSLAKYPKVFSELYINMVRVGETGGNLKEVLEILAEQMKKDHQLISRVRGAMMYPSVIIIAMIGIGILMMTMVVPKITEMFSELNIQLPLATRIVIGVSNFLQNHFFLALAILAGFIVLIRLLIKVKEIKSLSHKIYLSLPILGPLVRKINAARFSRTLSSLVDSGVAIVKALEIVAGTLTNVHFKKTLFYAVAEVQKGEELSKALIKYKDLYTPMVIQMIKIGEETGTLTKVLKNLANFYEQEVDNTTRNLSSIIEPILMILIGAAVGFFAVSMIQPMYSMMSGI